MAAARQSGSEAQEGPSCLLSAPAIVIPLSEVQCCLLKTAEKWGKLDIFLVVSLPNQTI